MWESFPEIKESHLTHIHVATDILRSQLLKEQMWSPVNLQEAPFPFHNPVGQVLLARHPSSYLSPRHHYCLVHCVGITP